MEEAIIKSYAKKNDLASVQDIQNKLAKFVDKDFGKWSDDFGNWEARTPMDLSSLEGEEDIFRSTFNIGKPTETGAIENWFQLFSTKLMKWSFKQRGENCFPINVHLQLRLIYWFYIAAMGYYDIGILFFMKEELRVFDWAVDKMISEVSYMHPYHKKMCKAVIYFSFFRRMFNGTLFKMRFKVENLLYSKNLIRIDYQNFESRVNEGINFPLGEYLYAYVKSFNIEPMKHVIIFPNSQALWSKACKVYNHPFVYLNNFFSGKFPLNRYDLNGAFLLFDIVPKEFYEYVNTQSDQQELENILQKFGYIFTKFCDDIDTLLEEKRIKKETIYMLVHSLFPSGFKMASFKAKPHALNILKLILNYIAQTKKVIGDFGVIIKPEYSEVDSDVAKIYYSYQEEPQSKEES
jgi:hypothetical protein